MHYPDESYVRVYTRKTLTNRQLKWDGRAVMHAMIGGEEFDRAGVFPFSGDPAECIATVTELPLKIVRSGLARLLETKTWILTADAVVWPAYVEAQTCPKSDKGRQRESRAWRAAKAVTPRHAPSHAVTPNLAEPNRTDLSLERAHEPEPAVESGPAPPVEASPVPPAGAVSAHEGEPEPATRSRTRGRRRRRAEPAGHWQFPAGWRWSPATTAAAARAGVTESELAAHVAYWTPRRWSHEVTDLDGALVLAFDGIKGRRAPSEPLASNPYAWAPTAEHRAFATSKGLPLQIAVDAYRASKRPDDLGTLRANDDFMARLRAWAATGEFKPTGPLPKPREAARGAA